MKKFFITGSSSGIGKALAEKALEQGHRVVGLSRHQSIEHNHYHHVQIDLSDLDNYVNVTFETIQGADELALINNAGTLGDVHPVGQLSPEKVAQAYRLNLLAPSILSSLFIAHTRDMSIDRTIINISSGAAQYPVKSWSTYCASKAALDMFSKVTQADHPEMRCFSIAPGIVDTPMQGEIRAQNERNFPDRQRFVDYKAEGALAQPSRVAEQILRLLEEKDRFPEVTYALRDLQF